MNQSIFTGNEDFLDCRLMINDIWFSGERDILVGFSFNHHENINNLSKHRKRKKRKKWKYQNNGTKEKRTKKKKKLTET